MANISVVDQQSLATEVVARLSNLDANTTPAELVYYARLIEIFNGNANLSAVSAEGTTQINRVVSEGDTQDLRVTQEGTTQVAAVQAASQTEQAALSGLQESITSALQGFKMSPAKVYFLAQS